MAVVGQNHGQFFAAPIDREQTWKVKHHDVIIILILIRFITLPQTGGKWLRRHIKAQTDGLCYSQAAKRWLTEELATLCESIYWDSQKVTS